MPGFRERLQSLFGSKNSRPDLPRDDIFWTQNALVVFGIIAISAVLSYSLYAASATTLEQGNYFTRLFGVFGTLTAVAFAAFGVGGILGFLFGIPKAVAVEVDRRPATDANEHISAESGEVIPQTYRSNTNLEEISDWLTKIIVGATLIEFKEIGGFLSEVISHTATGMEAIPFAKTITGAVIIGFLILGFFAIYLMTRLYLAGAFSRLEGDLRNAFRKQEKIQATVDQKFDDLGFVEKQKLKEVLDAPGNVITLPSTFVRHSPDHQALQSLKDRGLVEVRGGGRWRPGSIATLTELGKSLREKLLSAISVGAATQSPDHPSQP